MSPRLNGARRNTEHDRIPDPDCTRGTASLAVAGADPHGLPVDSTCARTVNQAQKILLTQPVILAFCERNLPTGGCGELLQWGKDHGISTPLVVSSRSVDELEYVEAMQRGAFDYIAPPYQRTEIEVILRRRREPRHDVNLPVQVYGTNADGLPFLQFANTHNISYEGAQLCGLNHRLEAGAAIGVRCYEKEGYFRVVWARKSGSESYEIGVHNLTPGHEIWGLVCLT